MNSHLRLYDPEECNPATRAAARAGEPPKDHAFITAALNLPSTPVAANINEVFYSPIADVEVCKLNTCLGASLLSRVPEPLDCDVLLADN